MNVIEEMSQDECERCPSLVFLKRIPISNSRIILQTLRAEPVSGFSIYREMHDLLKKMQRELGDQAALFAFDYSPPGVLKVYVAKGYDLLNRSNSSIRSP